MVAWIGAIVAWVVLWIDLQGQLVVVVSGWAVVEEGEDVLATWSVLAELCICRYPHHRHIGR